MLASLLLLATFTVTPPQDPPAPPPEAAPEAPADSWKPDPAWKSLGPDLWFDPAGKRVVLRARVCLREGYLEHLLCLNGSKEHESILATAAPARALHVALLLTGAEVGHPVQFEPKFAPPAGTSIQIELSWTDAAGKLQTANARDWVQDDKSKAALAADWVFAGSSLFEDPFTKKMVYAAESGDYITVANFMSAILDLPFASSADDLNRSFVAFTERIPPRDTPVTMSLRPVAPAAPKPPEAAEPK
jgi:hypothetical protein